MSTLAQVVQLAAVVLGISGTLAAALAVTRSSHIRQVLELLRGEVADLREANARLEGENSKLNQEVIVLREMVTSRANVEELTAEVRTLVGIIRSDCAHLSETMAALLGGKLRYGPQPSPPGRRGGRNEPA